MLVGSEGILKLREIFMDSAFVYLILDYQEKGSILGQILGDVKFTEHQTKMIMT